MNYQNVPKAALILAGGEGKRLRPLTYQLPKPLIQVNGKPILEYSIKELEKNGIKEMIISVGYKGEKIINYIKSRKKSTSKITFVKEDTLLGTGGAIKLAFEKYKFDDILVINGDNIFELDIAKMYKLHKKSNALITMALVKLKDVTGTGVVVFNGRTITEFTEKPLPSEAKSNITNAGIQIINKKILEKMPNAESFSFEKDMLPKIIENKNKISGLIINNFYTVNTIGQLKEVEEKLKNGV